MDDVRTELDGDPGSSREVVEDVLRHGARRLLLYAIESDVAVHAIVAYP